MIRLFTSMVLLLALNLLHNNAHSKEYLYVSDRPNVGLFSIFSTVIGSLHQYEINRCSGIRVDFKNEGLYYDPRFGSNWWEYYFEPINIGVLKRKNFKKLSISEMWQNSYYVQFKMSREMANSLICKYIKIKPSIQKKIEDFQQNHFLGKFVIGVHYRGTDKKIEAPVVSYEEVYKSIQDVVHENNLTDIGIFVATDDALFLEFIKNRFNNQVFAIDAVRAIDGQPVHFSNIETPYKRGEDAVIDCLLLSKCNFLIKTASNLSDCSLMFNPSMPFIRLNKENGGS